MDGRVRIVATTITLLLALASVAGARMNPVMIGGGVASSGGASIFSDTFSSDLSLWDSETDVNNIGEVSGGAYVVTQTVAGQKATVNKSFSSEYKHFSVGINVEFSGISNVCANSGEAICLWDGGEASYSGRYYIRARCTSTSGPPTQLAIGYYNGSSNTYQLQPFSFAADTIYNIKVEYNMAVAGGGYVKSWIDDTQYHNISNLSNDDAKFTRTRVGITDSTFTGSTAGVKIYDISISE